MACEARTLQAYRKEGPGGNAGRLVPSVEERKRTTPTALPPTEARDP